MNMQQLISIFRSSCVAGLSRAESGAGSRALHEPRGGYRATVFFYTKRRKQHHRGAFSLVVLPPCCWASVREAQRGVRSCFVWRNKSGKNGERCLCGRPGLEAARHERPLTGPVVGERGALGLTATCTDKQRGGYFRVRSLARRLNS